MRDRVRLQPLLQVCDVRLHDRSPRWIGDAPQIAPAPDDLIAEVWDQITISAGVAKGSELVVGHGWPALRLSGICSNFLLSSSVLPAASCAFWNFIHSLYALVRQL